MPQTHLQGFHFASHLRRKEGEGGRGSGEGVSVSVSLKKRGKKMRKEKIHAIDPREKQRIVWRGVVVVGGGGGGYYKSTL